MKTLKVTAIVFLSLFALMMLTTLGVSLATGGSGFGLGFGSGSVVIHSDYTLVLEKEVPADRVSSLKIEYAMTSNDVFFYPCEGENIIIREYMNYTPKESNLTTVKQSGSELIIKGAARTFLFFFSIRSGNAYTEIYLPQGFAENLDNLLVKTSRGNQDSKVSFALRQKFDVYSTSGDIRFPNVKAAEVEGSTVSGNIFLDSVVSEQINLAVISGDVTLNQSQGRLTASSASGNIRLNQQMGDTDISTVSGDISLEKVSGDMNLSTTSGDIRLQDGMGFLETDSVSGDARIDSLTGDFSMSATSGYISLGKCLGHGNAETVSGDVRIFSDALDGDLYVSTTSGNVSLRLPKDASFSLDYDSTSGKCRTFFDEMVSYSKKRNTANGSYGDGTYEITISTISGDLDITN